MVNKPRHEKKNKTKKKTKKKKKKNKQKKQKKKKQKKQYSICVYKGSGESAHLASLARSMLFAHVSGRPRENFKQRIICVLAKPPVMCTD